MRAANRNSSRRPHVGADRNSRTRRCQHCREKEDDPDLTPSAQRHKKCAKCGTLYCSRECQAADWKEHKTWCKKGMTAEAAMAEGLDKTMSIFSGNAGSPPAKFVRDAAYLNSLSKQEALKRIVDSYRLRVDDEYHFKRDIVGLYAQEDPVEDFEDYLDVAERKGGILPSWWNEERRRECVELGRGSKYHCLHYAVEKHDIIDQYKDHLMPMRLRMIAQMVTGEKVGGL